MPSLKKSKVKSSRWDLPAGFTVAFLALMLLLGPAGVVEASTINPVSIKLTSGALLGSDKNFNINHGKNSIVYDDVPGFYTSGTTGKGSILKIQADGKAGLGTSLNPLFVTVTARSRLNVDVDAEYPDFPKPNDYQAGIITLTSQDNTKPFPVSEGLGVKAFTVVTSGERIGLRLYDTTDPYDDAWTEGSKHVSGGTDIKHVFGVDPNGAPHEDEDVTFKFNPAFNVFADSVEVLLSDFELTDIIVLSIDETFNEHLSPATSTTGIFEEVGTGNNLWKLKFAGLDAAILVESFTIQAFLSGSKKNHFFINGLDAEYSPVPIPGAVYLLGSGLIGLAGIRRRFRK